MNKFSLNNNPNLKSGFTTPNHYFDDLSVEILAKLSKEKPKKGKIFNLRSFVYVAAAILILALSIPFFTSKSVTSLEQIDTTTLENYITYQSNVSQYELINMMDSKDLESMNVNLSLEESQVEEILITNPNFENYIIE